MTCVRCGKQPRDPNVFLCAICRRDPEVEGELVAAWLAIGRPTIKTRAQRYWLMENKGWAGGWQRRGHEQVDTEIGTGTIAGRE